ncbi:regulatory protein, tetR family [Thermostaphylospora chromogena]|uniref:Regulatory protein, tetR family n=1 Tax=Thermostaphylospora chromogena TaxID=35622 RepID=A0A1H1C484_9ACTN|nr:regulatory protein, tetR family [Thermostaphylospora chromogena]
MREAGDIPTDGVRQERRRPGRRPGAVDTRGEILAAARRVFAEKGFDKATIRGIAREAKVDPALVHHYFESKEGVFVAAMRLPLDPREVIPKVLAGPREDLGRRLAEAILTTLEDARARDPIVALMRTAMTNERVVAMVREFFTGAVLSRAGERFGVPPLRMQAVFAHMFGIVMMRHIVGLEPLASASVEEIVDTVGPVIQRYIDGE